LKAEKRKWLNNHIRKLIDVHKKSQKMFADIRVLSYTNSEVASIVEIQRKTRRKIISDFMHIYKEELKVNDLEASAIIADNIICAIAEEISFGTNDIVENRILDEGVDALMKYLYND
jgi:hypothetical protein